MKAKARVMIVGLEPAVVDFSQWPGLTAEKLQAALEGEIVHLKSLGYEADLCLVDRGISAGATVANALRAREYGCVAIGAGLRKPEDLFLLFESLVNVVHEEAPRARICFNTNPSDTVAAVQRWA